MLYLTHKPFILGHLMIVTRSGIFETGQKSVGTSRFNNFLFLKEMAYDLIEHYLISSLFHICHNIMFFYHEQLLTLFQGHDFLWIISGLIYRFKLKNLKFSEVRKYNQYYCCYRNQNQTTSLHRRHKEQLM